MSAAAQEGRIQISHTNGVSDILTPDVPHTTVFIHNDQNTFLCKMNDGAGGFTIRNIKAGDNNVTCGTPRG